MPGDNTSASRIDNSCYYKVGNTIYCTYKDKTLSGVDPKTFQVFSFLVAKDKNHVYIENQIQPDYDADTFKSFSKADFHLPYIEIFSDKNGYYSLNLNNKLDPVNIDFDSAKNIDPQYISDKNGIYYLGNYKISKLETVDAASFRILGPCMSVEMSYGKYAADRNHVIVGNAVIPGIGPNSFIQIAKIISPPDSEIPYTFYLWKDSKNIYVLAWAFDTTCSLEHH